MARVPVLFTSFFLLTLPRVALAFSIGAGQNAAASHRLSSTARTSFPQSSDIGSKNSPIIVGPDLPPIEPNSKRLLLIRHGEVINPGGDRPVYYGAMDVPLSPLGEQEAQAAGSYLEQFDLEYVVSSPLSRAIYGANQVLSRQSKNDGKEIVTLEGFTELDRGDWCGRTKAEIGTEQMERFNACDETATPKGGESYAVVKKRVLLARDKVLEMLSPGRAAAIVSHLQVTRCILSDALGIPTEEMSTLPVATASVTCIDYDATTKTQTVHFQSFKPDVGLDESRDGAN